MRKNRPHILLTILIFFSISPAAQVVSSAENTPAQRARIALRKAAAYFCSISNRGGYAGLYSPDLEQRYGESRSNRIKATEIWVQSPGTPEVGQCLLRAYGITREKQYLAAAVDAALALAWGQRMAGGWGHRVDVAHMESDFGKMYRKIGHCSFDDNTTQGALVFMMNLDEVIEEQWLSEAIELGLEFMMSSQFSNGAWPQWYPLRGGYHDYYTFNDNAINDCIAVMLNAHRIYGKEKYLGSARRGGDFMILSRLPSPQAGWAQQYTHRIEPAGARGFEPPGICSAVTGRNIRTLADLYLYTRDEKYLIPVPDAIDWLQKSRTEDGMWARVYEPGSNRPIYGERIEGSTIYYDYKKISAEERSNYDWRGDFGINEDIDYCNNVLSMGAESYLEQRTKNPASPPRERLIKSVEEAIAALDDQGRWLENEIIDSGVFIRNVNLLCDYLELSMHER